MNTIANYYSKFSSDELRIIQFAFSTHFNKTVNLSKVPFLSLLEAGSALAVALSQDIVMAPPQKRRLRQLRRKLIKYDEML